MPAFEYAKRFGHRSVTICEKPNVVRETSGMMLAEAKRVSGDFPGIELWDVNVDAEYHEEVRAGDKATGDRLVPGRAEEAAIEELIRDAFARYDAVALGTAVGVLPGLGGNGGVGGAGGRPAAAADTGEHAFEVVASGDGGKRET